MSSERLFTLFIAEHITLSNLVRIVLRLSHGFTSVQGSGAALLAGYSSALVPDYTTIVRVQSTGNCSNSIDITLT